MRLLLALLPCLSYSAIIDRSFESRPLLVSGHLDLSEDTLIDNNWMRPAIIVLDGGSLKLGHCVRQTFGVQARDTDPGLGQTFDGQFLPQLQIGFSHHDFARAFVVGMGSVKIEAKGIKADTCVLLVANGDGSYGKGSKVSVDQMTGFRFGVLASGQEDLDCTIDKSEPHLWPRDFGSGPGHTFYANESRKGSEFLRLLNPRVRVNSVRTTGNGIYDHVTAKFKGSWNIDYECLDDQNPCGALDQYGSSGSARINWAHPGSEAKNDIFLAFRSGNENGFGTPPGKFAISGRFDATRADQSIPRYRWETKLGTFFGSCEVIGGAPGVAWAGTDVTGLVNKAREIVK